MVIPVVLLTLLALTANTCQPITTIPDFYSSKAIFELPSNQSDSLAFSYQTYNITLSRRYDRAASPQYAFALGEAAAATGNLTYFDLLVLKTFEASLIVNFIYEPTKWTRVAFNYWIAFRTDINLGVESFPSTQITNKNNGQYEIGCVMRQTVVNQVAALVFLSGIRFDASNGTNGHQLSFVIGKQYIENGKLFFSFNCNTTLPLASVTFAYVVFDPHSLPLASYGGTISSIGLASTGFKNLQYIVSAGTAYSFFGVSSIEVNNTFTLSSQLMSNLTLTYGVNEWEKISLLEITYVIIGQSPASICLRNPECQASGLLVISGQGCVASCPDTSRPVTHMDGAVECLPCPTNAIYSNVTRKCFCPSGFDLQSDASCLAQPQIQAQNSAVSYNRVTSGDELGGDGSSGTSSGCLKVLGVQANNKNLFITIQASKQVISDPQSSTKNYIQLKFSNTQIGSYYCSYSNEDSTKYNCLALFPLGVPTATIVTASCTLPSGSQCSSSFNYASARPQ